ncbi:MAG: YncE family protein [Gammaproteobacteria bacterium]|nr:YncE family protein [Gammaproteobacteria bacterium]
MRLKSKIGLWISILIVIPICESVWADGPFALVSGRWDPSVIVVDLSKALESANNATSNAIVSRIRVTRDVDTDGDGIADAPAAGLPSNVVISSGGQTAFVVNHAGNAMPADVAAFAHGHPGTITVLDLRAALDPANNETTNAIEAVIPSGGYGPVGFAQSDDSRFAFVGSSEGGGNEDGGSTFSVIDLARREVAAVLQLPLGDGGKVAQDSDRSCAQLLANPSRIPHGLPNGNVGCFPDINALGFSGRYALAANGGTDDVSVIDIQRAIDGGPDVEVARIAVERGPWGLAVSPGGDLAAVTNRESAETGLEGNTVSILEIDKASGGDPDAEVARVVVGTDDVAVGTRPFGLAFTPDGHRIVVANFRSNNVSLVDVRRALDGSEGAELARIPLTRPDGGSSRPRGVAITLDGRFAVISGGERDAAGGGSLWIVDLDSAEVVATVTGVGNEPYLLAIAPEINDLR